MFWTKKPMKSEEYEELSKRFVKLQTEIDILVNKVGKLETDFRSQRGKINSMLSEVEEDTPQQTKSFNTLNPFSSM